MIHPSYFHSKMNTYSVRIPLLLFFHEYFLQYNCIVQNHHHWSSIENLIYWREKNNKSCVHTWTINRFRDIVWLIEMVFSGFSSMILPFFSQDIWANGRLDTEHSNVTFSYNRLGIKSSLIITTGGSKNQISLFKNVLINHFQFTFNIYCKYTIWSW
jgi:hypothetical protein